MENKIKNESIDLIPNRSRDLEDKSSPNEGELSSNKVVNSIIILDRIKELINIKTDLELAKYLGISQNTIYSWKSRDSVDVWVIFQRLPKLDWNYIFYGEGFNSMIEENEARDQELLKLRKENQRLKEDAHDLRKVLVNLSSILADKG